MFTRSLHSAVYTFKQLRKAESYILRLSQHHKSLKQFNSKQKITEKENNGSKEEVEENWGGNEAFKLIIFIKDDFDVQIKNNPSILVFFSATWCHHCLRLRKPYGMAALMAKEANLPMTFATFDVSYNPDLAQEKGVVAVPLIKYYKNGKFITNYKGKRTSNELFDFAKNPPTDVAESKKVEF